MKKQLKQVYICKSIVGCIFSEEESLNPNCNRNITKQSLPEGFEFVKRVPLEVKRVTDIETINEIIKEKDNGKPIEIYNLKNINNKKNLVDYDIFAITRKNEILSVIVIDILSKTDVEIKELITKKEYRNKGYGTRLLKSMIGNYKQKYKNMIVGTTGNYIPYFVENGFICFLKKDDDILYYEKKL